MKIAFLTVIVAVLVVQNVYAEKIHLKSGETIDAPILSRDHGSITVKQGAAFKKYYNDQILEIEEEGVPVEADIVPELTAAKKDLIKEFIIATGTKSNLEKNFENIVNKAPVEKREEYKNLLNVDEVIEELLPVYNQYYSEEELRSLIEFYSSPVGQKVLEVTPKLTKDILERSVDYFKNKATAK